VPRAGNAMLTFNRRDMGMYVLVEGINKPFLRRYFKDPDGTVFEGKSGTDVTNPRNFLTNTDELPGSRARLAALRAAAQQRDLEMRMDAYEKALDVDRFLSFLAMEMILCHWDGYAIGRNNFRIYHDLDTDRMVFIPQGMDQMLDRPKEIFPNAQGLVARTMLEIPEARQRYLQRVGELTTNILPAVGMGARITEVSAKTEAALRETDPAAADAHRSRANALRRRLQARLTSLEAMLSPASRTKFDAQGTLALNDWAPQTDLGEADLPKEQDEKGNALLRISTKTGCTASWRTTKLLDRGKYRIEARIKTQSVVFPPNDPKAGAGLRVSRHRIGQKNEGNKDWTPIVFDFEVRDDHAAVELVCELRATQGDIWYDLSSLKLKRL